MVSEVFRRLPGRGGRPVIWVITTTLLRLSSQEEQRPAAGKSPGSSQPQLWAANGAPRSFQSRTEPTTYTCFRVNLESSGKAQNCDPTRRLGPLPDCVCCVTWDKSTGILTVQSLVSKICFPVLYSLLRKRTVGKNDGLRIFQTA